MRTRFNSRPSWSLTLQPQSIPKITCRRMTPQLHSERFAFLHGSPLRALPMHFIYRCKFYADFRRQPPQYSCGSHSAPMRLTSLCFRPHPEPQFESVASAALPRGTSSVLPNFFSIIDHGFWQPPSQLLYYGIAVSFITALTLYTVLHWITFCPPNTHATRSPLSPHHSPIFFVTT